MRVTVKDILGIGGKRLGGKWYATPQADSPDQVEYVFYANADGTTEQVPLDDDISDSLRFSNMMLLRGIDAVAGIVGGANTTSIFAIFDKNGIIFKNFTEPFTAMKVTDKLLKRLKSGKRPVLLVNVRKEGNATNAIVVARSSKEEIKWGYLFPAHGAATEGLDVLSPSVIRQVTRDIDRVRNIDTGELVELDSIHHIEYATDDMPATHIVCHKDENRQMFMNLREMKPIYALESNGSTDSYRWVKQGRILASAHPQYVGVKNQVGKWGIVDVKEQKVLLPAKYTFSDGNNADNSYGNANGEFVNSTQCVMLNIYEDGAAGKSPIEQGVFDLKRGKWGLKDNFQSIATTFAPLPKGSKEKRTGFFVGTKPDGTKIYYDPEDGTAEQVYPVSDAERARARAEERNATLKERWENIRAKEAGNAG